MDFQTDALAQVFEAFFRDALKDGQSRVLSEAPDPDRGKTLQSQVH